MHEQQRARAAQLLEENGVDCALFSDIYSVRWLTGLNLPAPALVWFDRGGFTLLADEGFAPASSFSDNPDCSHETFVNYTIQQPIDPPGRLAEIFGHLVAESGAPAGRVGIEEKSLFLSLWQTLNSALAGCEPISLEGKLLPLRAVKTEEELARIREGFRLVTIGHDAGRKAVRKGQREIDVWTEVQTAVEREAGMWMEMGNDCIVGHRPSNMGAAPLDYEIYADDSLILDLSVVVDGYWTDSCATYFANQPTALQLELHKFVEEALEFAVTLLRPGVVAQEVDRQVRRYMADGGYEVYPHHSGHGIGLTSHEAPRIVPYSQELIEEGNVIMLEPGIYIPGVTGVRLEDAFLVTADGAEPLSHHDKSLPQGPSG
ncbi:MAG: Xaa-Pro peptidase family protein [Caldilineaceae bacterium]|nr:Xaa-Pro peptidase family protein [Caldilineaceae bacterium]